MEHNNGNSLRNEIVNEIKRAAVGSEGVEGVGLQELMIIISAGVVSSDLIQRALTMIREDADLRDGTEKINMLLDLLRAVDAEEYKDAQSGAQ